MAKMKAIVKKELRIYFSTPMAYIFIAAFVCVTAILFTMFNLFAASAAISTVFSFLPYIFVFMIPLLTMRLIAEERSLKTDQLLLTAPVRVSSIVFGKLISAVAVFGCAMLLMLIFPVILRFHADVEWGVVFTNYVGFFLLGSALISLGMFISSLTENQLVSAVITIAVIFVTFLIAYRVNASGNMLLEILVSVVALPKRFDNFFIGIMNLADVVYYVSVTFVFALLTVYRMEKRRISK